MKLLKVKTVRFAEVVEKYGVPEVYTLWQKPARDRHLPLRDSPDDVEDDWLCAPMFFSHYGAKRNRALVREAGFDIEMAVVEEEPGDRHGALFLWVIGHKPAEGVGGG